VTSIRLRRKLRSRQPRRGGRALGLTGIPFTDVITGAPPPRARSPLLPTRSGLDHGRASPSAWTSTYRRFSADPRQYACPSGTASSGSSSPRSSSDEDQQVHAPITHLALDAGQGGGEEPAKRCVERERVRRKPLSEDEILGSPMLNYPLTQYMFCSPDEGAAAVVLCRAEDARRYTDTRSTSRTTYGPGASALSRFTALAPRRGDRRAHGGRVASGVRDRRPRPRRRRRHTAPGHRRRGRDHPPRRERLLL